MRPRYIFLTLFSINLLNYIDRQILYAVFPLIQADLKLTDTHLGVLGSAFMIVYMIVAPFIGYFADLFIGVKLQIPQNAKISSVFHSC